MMLTFVLIGSCDYFGFGFSTHGLKTVLCEVQIF